MFAIDGKAAATMPCCGIYAVAVATGRMPQDIFDLYRVKFNKGPKWKGSTNIGKLLELLADLNVPVEHWNARAGRRTLRCFVRDVAEVDTTYLVRISGHFLIVRNSIVTDQTGFRQVEDYRRRRSTITHCYAIKRIT